MPDSPSTQADPLSDLAETIKFLGEFSQYIQGGSQENLRAQFQSMPQAVRRLTLNLAVRGWSEATSFMQKLGASDQQALESIRPLVEHFRPLAGELAERLGLSEELRKDSVHGIRPRYLYEMSTGLPILHLQFLTEDEKVLFESRESTPGALANALGITLAVAQSFEYCKKRNLILKRPLVRHIEDLLRDFLSAISRVAGALDIPKNQLFDSFREPVLPGQADSGDKKTG